MASAKFKNNMTDSLSKSTMIASTIADLECPIQRFWKRRICFYSCGEFNTPTLCVVTKGIKAECNHLMRTYSAKH